MREPYAEYLERALAEIDKVIALEPRWPSGHVLSAQLLPAEARAIRAAFDQAHELREALREALREYGGHKEGCPSKLAPQREGWAQGPYACSCGFREALLAQPAAGEERERK